MPGPAPLRDIVIVLPGIAGSNLSRHGEPLWQPSLGAVRSALLHPVRWAQIMGTPPEILDDPEAPIDVEVDGLISTARSLPGLGKANPYRELRRMLAGRFDIVAGDVKVDGPPANYFELAYDWRRDNRIAALELKRLVDRERPKWESTLPSGRAKVILIAHSMGGLVSKFYLDALGGWDTCRALLTFGTPFRGSVKALGFLANGFRVAGIEIGFVTEIVSALTSVYQLLPMYPVIRDTRPGAPEGLLRVSELDEPCGGLDLQRARKAYDFQRQLTSLPYPDRIAPIMGIGQKTLQTAELTAKGLTVSRDAGPLRLAQKWLGSGDSTVPAISATPVGFPELHIRSLANASHATIHSSAEGLDLIGKYLDLLQSGLEDFQELDGVLPARPADRPQRSIITLDVEDLYVAGQPLDISYSSTDPEEELSLRVSEVDSGIEASARWATEGLAPGVYEARVTGRAHDVTDIFEVI